ncbi:MAG TPA: GNAT family N-acetyltransferase [Solirubrobacteraceae bacterium]|nr:GNAT family N-acetyltransferase [Solirubrobacteraceae bacterium]
METRMWRLAARVKLVVMAENPLMPGSTPREEERRPPEQRLLVTLDAQLRALDRDIRAARWNATHLPRLDLEHDASARPGLHGEVVRLRDGAEVLIRPVEPADAEPLRRGFDHLGEVSRYRRFLTRVEHLALRQATALTNVDHERHEALIALDPASGEGVGIARYVLDEADPRRAEFAITIADVWQGRGVGTALFDRLADRARGVGIEVLTARMIVGNEAARRLLAHRAEIVGEERDSGTVRVTARLAR